MKRSDRPPLFPPKIVEHCSAVCSLMFGVFYLKVSPDQNQARSRYGHIEGSTASSSTTYENAQALCALPCVFISLLNLKYDFVALTS